MNGIIEFALFFLVVVFCFYLPGKYLFYKLKLELNALENVVLPILLGILLFILVAYCLAWLHLSVLLLPILLGISILAIQKKVVFAYTKSIPIHKYSLALVFIWSLIFSACMLVTGMYGDTILYKRDDLWHLALINELKVHFPPDNPGVAEIPLRGYHFFYDFIAAQISNGTFISTASLHFHLMPLLGALLWGFGVYAFMLRWTGKNSAGLWAVFLTMFGGNFVFVLHFIGFTDISFDNGFGITQPAYTLYNPALYLSYNIIILALFSFYQYLHTKKKAWLVPLTLCCGLAPMIKVYAGIILIAGLCMLVLFDLLKKKFFSLIALSVTAIFFFFTYWIFVGGTGYLIFFPFWYREGLLRSLTWFGWDEKISTYTRLHVTKGLVETVGTGLVLFLVGNLGTRVIGLLALPIVFFKKRKLPSQFSIIVTCMLSVSILFPLFFLQSGKVYEIVQMATYFLFFASLFAALGFSILFNLKFHRILKLILIVAIIAATLPSAYITISDYFRARDSAINLNNEFFQAMKALSSQGTYNDTVLELPPKYDNVDKKSLAGWYPFTNPAISAFANKRTFLNYEYIEYSNLPIVQRIDYIHFVLSATSKKQIEEVEKSLQNKKIRYIYTNYELAMFQNSKHVKKIFSNKSRVIYKVD